MPGWEGGCSFRKDGHGKAFNETTFEQTLRGREKSASHGSIWSGEHPREKDPREESPGHIPHVRGTRSLT